MLNLRPYLQRPISTLSAIASDPLEYGFGSGSNTRHTEKGIRRQICTKPRKIGSVACSLCLNSLRQTRITSEFWDLWPQVITELDAKGVRAGPESFKRWNDGDAAFVRAIWCLVRRLRPRNVVETGVAHGVTSRFILEGLEKNGMAIFGVLIGHQWNLSGKPKLAWLLMVGFKERWSYISGSSRRRLPSVLGQLGEIDLFVHDSLHSARNVRFEMDRRGQPCDPAARSLSMISM